jgi:hypothetical protein
MVRTGRSTYVAVLAVLGGLVLGACGGGDDGGSAGVVEASDQAEVDGVTVVPVASANHVNGTVDYPTSPPAGGNHNPVWQNCGFYTEAVVPELAVHSLEHGAVWITYRPDVDAATVDALEAAAAGSDYVLASPYPDNPSPLVLSAWGRQVGVDSMDDPVVRPFLETYLQDGPTTPEPGAACSGAVGAPPDQPDSLIR